MFHMEDAKLPLRTLAKLASASLCKMHLKKILLTQISKALICIS